MLKVALTGGIATGKSYVLARIASHGVPTIDADRVARDVTGAGSLASHAIRNRFGDGVFDAGGALDRRALGAVVFADPAARKDLEAIVHPAVYRAISGWFQDLPADSTGFAVADIPLLFETGRQGDFDMVIVTAAPVDLQLERLIARDGLSEADARRRIAAQWPIEEKVRLADRVIDTSGTKAETDLQVDAIVSSLLGPSTDGSPQG